MNHTQDRLVCIWMVAQLIHIPFWYMVNPDRVFPALFATVGVNLVVMWVIGMEVNKQRK